MRASVLASRQLHVRTIHAEEWRSSHRKYYPACNILLAWVATCGVAKDFQPPNFSAFLLSVPPLYSIATNDDDDVPPPMIPVRIIL